MQNKIKGIIRSHPYISYAQFGEDIVLYKLLNSVENGFYIDIGCAQPVKSSVTKFFYDRGWTGINIDPREEIMSKYISARPNDINLTIAISDKNGEYLFWENGGLSTFDEDTVERIGKANFKEPRLASVVRLDDIISQYDIHEIHFLKIDVEAHEKQVLDSIDLSIYRPWVIAVESTFPATKTPSHEGWEDILLGNSYVLITEYAINRYYVDLKYRDVIVKNFLKYPIVPYITHQHRRVLNSSIMELNKAQDIVKI